MRKFPIRLNVTASSSLATALSLCSSLYTDAKRYRTRLQQHPSACILTPGLLYNMASRKKVLLKVRYHPSRLC